MSKYLSINELEILCSKYKYIALDIDDTIIDSLQANVEILNKRFNMNVKKEDVKCWNFSDVYPQLVGDDIEKVFDSREFFNVVKFKNGAKDFILEHKDKVFLITKGNRRNLRRKKKWLRKNGLEDVKYIGIGLDESKDLHIPYNSLFIDDNVKNLNQVHCKEKILFATNEYAEWQKDWDGLRIKEWK